MTTPNHGSLRILRGTLLAAGTVSVTIAGHVLASGGLPDVGVALALALVMSAGCVAIADRRRSPSEIAAVVLVSQPVLHVLLSVAGHGTALSPSWTMVGAHAVAGLLITALLSQGEAVIWVWVAVSQLLIPVAALAGLLRHQPPALSPTLSCASTNAPLPRWTQFSPLVARRGPPVVVVA